MGMKYECRILLHGLFFLCCDLYVKLAEWKGEKSVYVSPYRNLAFLSAICRTVSGRSLGTSNAVNDRVKLSIICCDLILSEKV